TLDHHAGVGLAFGAAQLIDENGTSLGQASVRSDDYVWPAGEFLTELLRNCFIAPPSVMVRRSCYHSIGPFNEGLFWGIDWEFGLKVAARYDVAYSPRLTSAYRVHVSSATPVAIKTARTASDGYEVLGNIFTEISNSPRLRKYAPLRRAAYKAFAKRAL